MPPEDLHCEVIHGIRVNVTDAVTGSHQYFYDQPTLLHANDSDERSYKFTFQVEHDQFFRPLHIIIAVMNSIAFSPFSDHIILTGISNGNVI